MNRLILLCMLLNISCISDAVRMDWVIPCAFQHKLIPNTHYGTKIQFFYNGNNSECFNKCYHITESSLNANTNLTCIGKNITLFNMEFSLNFNSPQSHKPLIGKLFPYPVTPDPQQAFQKWARFQIGQFRRQLPRPLPGLKSPSLQEILQLTVA